MTKYKILDLEHGIYVQFLSNTMTFLTKFSADSWVNLLYKNNLNAFEIVEFDDGETV